MRLCNLRIAIVTLSALLLLGLALYGSLKLQLDREAELAHARLSTSHQSLLAGYQEFADVAVDWLLSDPQSLTLMLRMIEGDRKARGLLYRKWAPLFESLRGKHVRQLQFIDATGRSQLRMHAPHQSGDQLLAIRPLISHVLENGEKASGFENGSIFSGFRFMYPVKQQDEVIGALGLGLSFAAFRRQLEKDSSDGTVLRFLLSMEDLRRTTRNFEGASVDALLKSLYMPALGSNEFVTENLANPLFDSPDHILPAYAWHLEARIGRDRTIRRQMQAGDGGAHLICTNWQNCFYVTLLPVQNHAANTVAYILGYTPVPEMGNRVWHKVTLFLGGGAAAVLMAVLFSQGRRTRRHMQAIGKHVGKGIYVINQVGTITYANPAASAILGYSLDDLLHRQAHELFHSETEDHQPLASHNCPIRQVTESGEVYRSANEIFIHEDGSRIPVEVTASPVVEYGNVTSVVTVFDDIRVRLADQARLTESSAAFDQTVEGVMITDRDYVITRVNRAFTEVTGYSEDDVLGKTPAVLSSGRHSPAFYTEMYRQLDEDGVWQGEIINRRKNGECFPEWLSISMIRDAKGATTSYVAVFRDISEIKEKEDRLAHLARHDPLTGALNRNVLKDRLSHALERNRRRKRQVWVFLLDIDRFKQINDSLGHDIGDELLCETTLRFRNLLREDDTLARLGGDEFVLVFEDREARDHPGTVAEKLIAAMSAPFHLGGHELFVGVSIGVAIHPGDGNDNDTLLRNADAAMYMAKRAGGNNWRRFHDDKHNDPVERIRFESELRHAIENDELVLHYQPKLDLSRRTFTAVEALVRWEHPTEGLLAPFRFLPAAEDAKMMWELGNRVLRMAIRQLAEWHERGIEISVCINVDGYSVGRHDFFDTVKATLEEFDVDPAWLGIEITETTIAVQSDRVVSDLSRLAGMGVSLSIDDFGTGQSSLTRLKTLPFQVLKVDASFVRDMLEDHSDRIIVGATIALAHELNLTVVAEGVEKQEQLDALEKLGCDAIQGYLFAKPMPAAEIEQLRQRPVLRGVSAM
jgi:diguanylate cyclase (GGDEF)-like protein/PAS domain S-box-containing protein